MTIWLIDSGIFAVPEVADAITGDTSEEEDEEEEEDILEELLLGVSDTVAVESLFTREEEYISSPGLSEVLLVFSTESVDVELVLRLVFCWQANGEVGLDGRTVSRFPYFVGLLFLAQGTGGGIIVVLGKTLLTG